MDRYERIAIEAECTRLINHFMWCIDTGEHEEGIALFTPDCVFGRTDHTFEGHDGLRAMFASRGHGRKTAHITTNILIDVIDSDNAEGKAFNQIFMHEGPFDPATAPPLAPVTILEFDTWFKRTDDGWKASKWISQPDFRKA